MFGLSVVVLLLQELKSFIVFIPEDVVQQHPRRYILLSLLKYHLRTRMKGLVLDKERTR
jgi:hypothetical protein